jgi:hypothetical protein
VTRAIEIVREMIEASEATARIASSNDSRAMYEFLSAHLGILLSRLEAEEGEPLPEDAATDAPVVITIEGSYCGCENSNEDEACVNTSNGSYLFPRSWARMRRG